MFDHSSSGNRSSPTIFSKGNKMFRTIVGAVAAVVTLSGAASAETFEVHMMNRSENGTMVFEPSSLRIAVGDTVKFIPTDKGHNAESIEGMEPAGAEPFKGAINEEIDVTLTEPGFYGVKCNPHFGMGMVMVIAVGDETAPDESFLEGRLPKKAKEAIENSLSDL
tara:strand:- start:4103 stop:4597 length:495 start_codon:yes stop_codon:yes gene_type:complete